MPGARNREGDRLHDTSPIKPSGSRETPPDLSADEARGLIDAVLASYGLDAKESTDRFGWLHLSFGSSSLQVGVVKRLPETDYLVVLAPVLELPDDVMQLSGFYELLLELNHDRTLSAHLSIHDKIVYVGLARVIRALDEAEIDEAIRTVMTVVDAYAERLREALDAFVRQARPGAIDLPNIKMTPKEAQTISALLAPCDAHEQDILRYVMERWQKAGHIVDPRTGGIGLKIQVGDATYSIGAMRPAQGGHPPVLILAWEGLRDKNMFPTKKIDGYQSRVAKIGNLKITETTAHIAVTEAFNRDAVKRVLRAMYALARSAEPELAEEEAFRWDPNLPKMEIEVGPKTLAGIQETLQACEPRVQDLYAILVEGWNQAGATVQCSRPGRIYLKFKTREHEFPGYGKRSHKFNLAVLAAPKGKRGPSIDISWDLATREYPYLDYVADDVMHFEQVVANLPGFEQQGTVTRLLIDETFQPEHAGTLLKAMLALRTAGGAVD